jgi:hypothetical protein
MIAPNALRRREYKYLVSEDTAARIRRHIAGFCAVDRYAASSGDRYVIDTLYLDTPRLDSYRATVENAGDRYKLRIRRYPGADAGGPVFLEVKRRICETIHKTRGAVHGDWAALLERCDAGALAQVAAKHRAAVDNFVCHYHYRPYLPAVLVRYEREPYESLVDDYARVTFDRSMEFQRATALSLTPDHPPWAYFDHPVAQRGLAPHSSAVVLELKFTSAAPSWMRHLVHTLDLQRLAFCKYTRAIDELHAVPGRRTARAGLSR